MRGFEGVRLGLAENAAIWMKLLDFNAADFQILETKKKLKIFQLQKKFFFRRFFEGSLVNFGAQIARKRAAFFSAILWRFSSKISRPV